MGPLGGGQADAAFYDPEYLLAHAPAERVVPTPKRHTRSELVAIANSYFDSLSAHDGKIMMAHLGCVRVENGALTTQRPIPTGGESDCTAEGAMRLAAVRRQLAGEVATATAAGQPRSLADTSAPCPRNRYWVQSREHIGALIQILVTCETKIELSYRADPHQRQQARKILAERGIARLNELRAAGITAATVSRMERDGDIVRLGHGLFYLLECSQE